MESFLQILKQITVNSSDNGEMLTDTTRLSVIERLLENSDYELLHRGHLSFIYGKRRPKEGESVVLVSTHIDTVYSQCFSKEQENYFQGTFDNSFTNAAAIWNMLNGKFADHVMVAFTGDEEKDSQGAIETVCALGGMQCDIAFAMVLEVSNEGWEQKVPFVVENDLGLDLFTAHRLVELLKSYDEQYSYVHHAEPDESWDYNEYGIPCFTLSVPVLGDMHSDSGVLLRKSSFPAYTDVLALVANRILNPITQLKQEVRDFGNIE